MIAQYSPRAVTKSYEIRYASDPDRELWDGYVLHHHQASLFHLFGWRNVINRTYGHKTYHLMAYNGNGPADQRIPLMWGQLTPKIVGVLPLAQLKHTCFGNVLISQPFLDGGGILANCRAAEASLMKEAIRLGRELGSSIIELRHEQPISCWEEISSVCAETVGTPISATTKSHKVRMLLALPESAEILMRSFKAKLRSQVTKPLKEGLTCRTGGAELLSDFYRVFVANMRDLGSPVHSMELMRNVLNEFSERSAIFVVYKSNEPLAASLVVGHNKILRNPWASALRKYAPLGANMLLYLRMLEYACKHGYVVFDFGRSSPGEGTYRFKQQWGAKPAPLHWHYISLDGKPYDRNKLDMGRFSKAIRYWKMMPLSVTRLVGPSIRKHIGL